MANLNPLRKVLRNLSLVATGMTAVILGLASLEELAFLRPMQGLAIMIMSLCWVAYGGVRTMTGSKPPGRAIGTTEGPGEELVQKASTASFAAQDGRVAGDKAEVSFLAAEKDFAAYQYGRAARRYEKSIEARASLPAYLNWGASLINTSQFVQADEVLTIALHLAERLDRRDFRAACLANLAVVQSRRGRLAEAHQMCEQAMDLFRMAGDGRGQADVMLTLGNILAHKGERDAAHKVFEAALKRHEAARSDMGRANALGNLGNLSLQNGDVAEASAHHRAALAIHEQTGNPVGRANALTNIGNVRFREQKLDDAHKAYSAALEIYRQIEVPLGEASSLGNLGNVLFRQGGHDAALDLYERGLSIHTQIGNPHGRATALTNLGSLLSRMKRRDEALAVLYAARSLFVELGEHSQGSEAVADLIERLGGDGPKDGSKVAPKGNAVVEAEQDVAREDPAAEVTPDTTEPDTTEPDTTVSEIRVSDTRVSGIRVSGIRVSGELKEPGAEDGETDKATTDDRS